MKYGVDYHMCKLFLLAGNRKNNWNYEYNLNSIKE